MKKHLLAALLCSVSSVAWAQNPQCPDRPVTDNSNACANTRFVNSFTGSVTVGTSPILSGTTMGVLFNNAGILGNTIAGTSGVPFIGNGASAPAFGTMNLADIGAQRYLTPATIGQANPSRNSYSTGFTGVMGCPGSGWDLHVNYSGDGSYTVKETVESRIFSTSRTATSCIFFNPGNLALVDDTDWILYASNPSFASKNQLVLNTSFSSLTPTVVAQQVTAVTVSPNLTGYTASQVVGWTAYLSSTIYAQGTVQATAGGVIDTARFAAATGLPTAAVFTSTPLIVVQPPNMTGGTAILDVVNFKMSRQPPDVYPAPNSYLYNIMMEGYTGTAGVKGAFVEYVGMAGIVTDPTVGSTDGVWDFRRQVAGTLRHLYLGGGFYEPGVTTDKGVGSANLSTSYWLADLNSQTRTGSTWLFNATTADKIQFVSSDINVSVNNGGVALDVVDTTSPTLARIGASSSSLGQLALCGNTLGCGTLTPTASPNGVVWTLGTASGTLASSLPAPLTISATTGAGSWTGMSSGGILYANSTTTVDTANGCTLSANASMTCLATAASSTPQFVLTNTFNDANAAQMIVRKQHGPGGASPAGDVLNLDLIFNFTGAAFFNAAHRNSAQMFFQVDAVPTPAGTNVPSNISLLTSNNAGSLNQQLKFNSGAHIAITQATAPAVSACGTTPAVTSGSTDMGGEVVVGTAAPTSCTVTFGTAWTVAPKCVVGSNPQVAAFSWVSGTATLVITQTGTSSNRIVWQCGHAGV